MQIQRIVTPILTAAIDSFHLRSSYGGQALHSVLSTLCRIVRKRERMMDTWESFFREKSRRRSRHRYIERAMKGGILILLLGGIAVAGYMLGAGLPR